MIVVGRRTEFISIDSIQASRQARVQAILSLDTRTNLLARQLPAIKGIVRHDKTERIEATMSYAKAENILRHHCER